MSRTPLTTAQVLMLSPDEASSKAAKGLLSPAKWPTLGATDDAVWGECQGSGSKPYQTQVDVSGGGTSFTGQLHLKKFEGRGPKLVFTQEFSIASEPDADSSVLDTARPTHRSCTAP